MTILTRISLWFLPCLLLFIPIYAKIKGVAVYDEFLEGAKEGIKMVWDLLPVLIGMLAAIHLFASSGILEYISTTFPILKEWGIPTEILPLALVRPLSGSGALGLTAELIEDFGPDSYIGRFASILQGSTETTLYVLTVYFGAAKIKKIRYALIAGLCGDIVAFVAAYFFTVTFFY